MTHPAASAKNSQLKREERSDYRQICLTQTNPDIFSLPIFFLHPTPPKKSILPDLKRPTLSYCNYTLRLITFLQER